jgi:hypothetical protein
LAEIALRGIMSRLSTSIRMVLASHGVKGACREAAAAVAAHCDDPAKDDPAKGEVADAG